MKAYFILTIICIVFDTIGFIAELVRFGKLEGDERADVLLLVTSYVFLIIDFYYVCWVQSVRMNLPKKLQEYSTSAMYGFGTKFKREMTVGAIKARTMIRKGKEAASRGAKKMAGLYK